MFVAVLPYQPSTTAPFTDVVTDGAAISLVLALYSPPAALTGDAASTPSKTVIPAVAPTRDENRHVYEDGSNADTTLMYRAWLSAAPPMLLSRLTWVQQPVRLSNRLPRGVR